MKDLLKTRILGDIIKSLEFAKNEERTKIKELSDTLNALSKCLENIIQFLQENSRQIPPNLLAEINVHVEKISEPFENTSIGREVNLIAQRLRELIDNQDNPSDLGTWQDIQGEVKGLSNSTYISLNEKRIGQYVGRRRALLSLFSAGGLLSLAVHKYQHNKLEIIEEFPELTGENAFKMTSFLWTEDDPAAKYEKSIYSNQILHDPPQKLKKLVAEMTNGRFEIKISPVKRTPANANGDQISITEDILNQVNHDGNGDLDCAYSGIYYDNTLSLPLFLTTAIPFGLTPQEQMAWLNHETEDSKKIGEGLTYVQFLYKKQYKNIHTLPLACTGMQMGGWFKKKINTIEDFRGLNMRIPGLGKEILTKKFKVDVVPDCDYAGANQECQEISKEIPGHRIINNLVNGNLDAAEWIGPYEDMNLGIPDALSTTNDFWYYYYPGWWEPSTTFSIHINNNSWEDNRLCSTYRAIFESACSRVFNEVLADYNYKNGQALNILKTKYKNKIEVIPFNRNVLEAGKKGIEEYLDDWMQKNPDDDEIVKKWKNFKKNIRVWSKYEAYYTNWDDPA